MRTKELKLIISFHTTADAMAMEKECKERGVSGRLIPVPRSISAGCGLAFCAELKERDAVLRAMQSVCIEEDAIHECMV